MAQAGYSGAAPFMQVNVNLIQSPFPSQALAPHPPPSVDWAAGMAANAAGRDQAAGLSAQQQGAAAALAAWAARDVSPHAMPGSASHLGGGQGQDAASPPAASPRPRSTCIEVGSRDRAPRLASDPEPAETPGSHSVAATDIPVQPSPHAVDAREQQPHGGLAVSTQMAGPGQGYYGDYESWSAQFPIAAAFTQLLSPAATAAAHAMGQVYPQVVSGN